MATCQFDGYPDLSWLFKGWRLCFFSVTKVIKKKFQHSYPLAIEARTLTFEKNFFLQQMPTKSPKEEMIEGQVMSKLSNSLLFRLLSFNVVYF